MGPGGEDEGASDERQGRQSSPSSNFRPYDVSGNTSLRASFGAFTNGVPMVVTIGSAFFQDVLTGLVRAIVPHVHRLSVLFLIGAGLYLVFYWVWFSGSIL
jgi:hypothetical protein